MPTYLLATTVFIPLWLALFIYKKNKLEQILWSLAGLVLGPLVQYLHLKDWWSPTFICETCTIHIEDLLFGFLVGGVNAVLYNDLYVKREGTLRIQKGDILFAIFTAIGGFALTFIPVIYFQVHSFYSTLLAANFIAIMVLGRKPKFFIPMVISGLILALYSLLFYFLGLAIYPEWVQNEWMIDNLLGVMIMGIPIEELIWFFYVGFAFSCFWETVGNIKYYRR